jgi:hypothetical protein
MADAPHSDGLSTITDDRIIFEYYCFPFGGRKAVQLGDVERITVEPPA